MSGTCASTLLPMRSRPGIRHEALATVLPKNSTSVGIPCEGPPLRRSRPARCPDGDSPLQELLQEISVVARELDDQRGGIEPGLSAKWRHTRASAPPRYPRTTRNTVFGEDRSGVRTHRLHEEARVAHECPKWIERLHPADPIQSEIRVRQRRHAKVRERPLERRATEATGLRAGRTAAENGG